MHPQILLTRQKIKADLSDKDRRFLSRRLSEDLCNESKTEPILLPTHLPTDLYDLLLLGISYPHQKNSNLWLYQNCLYTVKGVYSQEEMRLLVLEEADKEREKFERLKMKFDSEVSQDIKYPRPTIPEEVRIAVWRRDQGKCVRSGSRENLEYDHIIPLSKGGSSTARNIELLCEKCNREKGREIR